MKRVLIASALILLVAGCRNSNTVDQLQPRPGAGAEGDSVTILAPLSTGLSRTMLQKDDETYNVYWVLDDEIGVFSAATRNAMFKLNETGVSTVAFRGEIAGTPTCAYYPYSSTAGTDPQAVSLSLPADQTQSAPSGTPETRKPNMAYDVKVGIKNGGDLASGYTFSFTQKMTLLHFVITPNATLDGDALQTISLQVAGKKLSGNYTLDITAAGNEPVFGGSASDIVTLAFDGTPTLAAGVPVEGWMFINPDIVKDESLVITIQTDKRSVITNSATASETFVRGALYEIAMNIGTLQADSKVDIVLLDSWYNQAEELGLYDLSPAAYSPVHQFTEYEDQYTYATTSASKYVFTIQGLKNGKLSRLAAGSAALDADDSFEAKLYTIHGTAGLDSTAGTWSVVRRDGTKLWLEKSDHAQGFIMLKEN